MVLCMQACYISGPWSVRPNRISSRRWVRCSLGFIRFGEMVALQEMHDHDFNPRRNVPDSGRPEANIAVPIYMGQHWRKEAAACYGYFSVEIWRKRRYCCRVRFVRQGIWVRVVALAESCPPAIRGRLWKIEYSCIVQTIGMLCFESSIWEKGRKIYGIKNEHR